MSKPIPSECSDYFKLLQSIYAIIDSGKRHSLKVIHKNLIIRNWLMGRWIVEYKQSREERSLLSKELLPTLKARLKAQGIQVSSLECLPDFCLKYPQFEQLIQSGAEKSKLTKVSKESKFMTPAPILIENLTFSHFIELLKIDDPVIRFFYEQECINNLWSANELRRQISSELHQKAYSHCNKSKEERLRSLYEIKEKRLPLFSKYDPHVLEFLGFDWEAMEYFSQTDPQKKLLLQLQNYLLDLNMRYAFMASQKEFLIDGQSHIADLVFYNINLHCIVIFMVRNDGNNQEHLKELNTILSYCQHNDIYPHEIPPIGLLINPQKENRKIEYALACATIPYHLSTYLRHLLPEKLLLSFFENELD